MGEYELLFETINKCIKKVEVEEIARQKLLVFGSNVFGKLEHMLKICKDCSEAFSFVYVGRENQIEGLDDSLRNGLELVPWEGRYDQSMLHYMEKKGVMETCTGVIFFSSATQNLRNMNIVELQQIMNMRYGMECYIYNFTMDEIYKFVNIDLYISGVNVILQMNDFMQKLNVWEEGIE